MPDLARRGRRPAGDAAALERLSSGFTKLRVAKFYDLRADPFERTDITSNTYWDWLINHAYIQYGAVAEIAKYLETYKEYPPSQRPASFSVDELMENMHRAVDPLIEH